MQRDASTPWKLDAQIRRIHHLLTQVDFVLEHSYRETKSAADVLAKRAASTQLSETYGATNLPKQVQGITKLDVHQYPYVCWVLLNESQRALAKG